LGVAVFARVDSYRDERNLGMTYQGGWEVGNGHFSIVKDNDPSRHD
jgi:hypothetical protein